MDRYILWLGLVCFSALSSPATVQAGCGTATCPLDLSTVHQHPLRLQIAFEHIAKDRLRAGTDKVTFGQITRPDHDEIETINRNTLLRLNYNFAKRFSTTLSLPTVQRQHDHIAVAGHDHGEHKHSTIGLRKVTALSQAHHDDAQRWEFTRPGDLTLWFRYTHKTSLAASIGIGAPTGQVDFRNGAGILEEPALQPGQGAWGLTLESSYERESQQSPRPNRLFVSTSYRVNSLGNRDYRFGDTWLFHAGGHYPIDERFDLLGQFACTWSDRDEAGSTGEYSDATGGTRLYFSAQACATGSAG